MNRQSVYVKVIWSVFSEGFLSSRRALALHHRERLLLFLWLCLLFSCFWVLKQNTSHCVCPGVIPHGNHSVIQVSRAGSTDFAVLFFYWVAGLCCFTYLRVSLFMKKILCACAYFWCLYCSLLTGSTTKIYKSLYKQWCKDIQQAGLLPHHN